MHPVRKMYKKAKNDSEFLKAYKLAEGKELDLPFWWDKDGIADVAAIYWGWMLAKGTYKKEDYE